MIRLTFQMVSLLASISAVAQPYFGNGIEIGETASDSTVVWLRLTEGIEPQWVTLRHHNVDGSVAYEYTFRAERSE